VSQMIDEPSAKHNNLQQSALLLARTQL
jgi:hypothetical protein